jgi:hypothetical protein
VGYIEQLLDPVLASAFDPDPVRFRADDERGVRPVREAVRRANGALVSLRPLNRNAFLCGCLDLTDEQSIEHLIVGFGWQHGSTTKVEQLAHATGSAGQVAIPLWIAGAIRAHMDADHSNEVVVFHNHPRNPLNVIFDNAPIASTPDRNLFTRDVMNIVAVLRTLMGGGRLRYFLGENGFVREFRTPPIHKIGAFLDWLSRATARPNVSPGSSPQLRDDSRAGSPPPPPPTSAWPR